MVSVETMFADFGDGLLVSALDLGIVDCSIISLALQILLLVVFFKLRFLGGKVLIVFLFLLGIQVLVLDLLLNVAFGDEVVLIVVGLSELAVLGVVFLGRLAVVTHENVF